jgi:hypothetical protein
VRIGAAAIALAVLATGCTTTLSVSRERRPGRPSAIEIADTEPARVRDAFGGAPRIVQPVDGRGFVELPPGRYVVSLRDLTVTVDLDPEHLVRVALAKEAPPS